MLPFQFNSLSKDLFDKACHDLEAYRTPHNEELNFDLQKQIPVTSSKKWISPSKEKKEMVHEYVTRFFETHKKLLEKKHFDVLLNISQKFNKERKDRIIALTKPFFLEEARKELEAEMKEREQKLHDENNLVRKKLLKETEDTIKTMTGFFLKNVQEKNVSGLIKELFFYSDSNKTVEEIVLKGDGGEISIKKKYLQGAKLFQILQDLEVDDEKNSFKKENFTGMHLEQFSIGSLKNFKFYLENGCLPPNITFNEDLDLYQILDFFDILNKKITAAREIAKKMTLEDALRLLSCKCGLPSKDPFMQHVYDLAALHFHHLVQSKALVEIQHGHLIEILKRDLLDTYGEELLFEDVFTWASQKKQEPLEVLFEKVEGKSLIEQIRFENMEDLSFLSFDKGNRLLSFCKENKLKRKTRPNLFKPIVVTEKKDTRVVQYLKINIKSYLREMKFPKFYEDIFGKVQEKIEYKERFLKAFDFFHFGNKKEFHLFKYKNDLILKVNDINTQKVKLNFAFIGVERGVFYEAYRRATKNCYTSFTTFCLESEELLKLLDSSVNHADKDEDPDIWFRIEFVI